MELTRWTVETRDHAAKRGDLSAHEQQLFDQFGNPGPSPYNGMLFDGWASDPSLAPVTFAQYSNSNKRMLVVNVAASGNGASYSTDDIVIAYSDDAGISWHGASFVDVAGPGGGGGKADAPHLASNPISPYDTYVIWDGVNDGRAYMRKVWFDAGGTFLGGGPLPPVIAVPSTPYNQRQALAFGKVPAGCSSGGEAIFVAASDGVPGNHHDCDPPGAPRGQIAPHWYLSVYDVAWNVWYGPWLVDDGTAQGKCLASGTNGGVALNSQDPKIAVNPSTSDFWITHTMPSGGSPNVSNKMFIRYGYLGCQGGAPAPTTNTWTSPTPCDPDPVTGACTYGALPDGGIAVQDEWQPAIGFVKVPGNPPINRALAYWYGTRDDVNNARANVYMTYSDNGGPFAAPVAIGVQDPGPPEQIPWPVKATEWDYNDLGVDNLHGRMMAVWGGDCRSGSNSTATVETELLY